MQRQSLERLDESLHHVTPSLLRRSVQIDDEGRRGRSVRRRGWVGVGCAVHFLWSRKVVVVGGRWGLRVNVRDGETPDGRHVQPEPNAEQDW